jgi:hypothetical protein
VDVDVDVVVDVVVVVDVDGFSRRGAAPPLRGGAAALRERARNT